MEDLIKRSRPIIKAIGIGKTGNNIVSRLTEMGIHGITESYISIALTNNLYGLNKSKANHKILINDINDLNNESFIEDFKNKLDWADIVFTVCELGDGSDYATTITELSKFATLSIAIVITPDNIEELLESRVFENELTKLQDNTHNVILVPKDKLQEVTSNNTINKVNADEYIVRIIQDIMGIFTRIQYGNVDMADLRHLTLDSGFSMITVGESESENKVTESPHKALNNPLLYLDTSKVRKALIIMSFVPLEECMKIIEIIEDQLNPNTEIIWTVLEENLRNTIRTTILMITERK